MSQLLFKSNAEPFPDRNTFASPAKKGKKDEGKQGEKQGEEEEEEEEEEKKKKKKKKKKKGTWTIMKEKKSHSE